MRDNLKEAHSTLSPQSACFKLARCGPNVPDTAQELGSLYDLIHNETVLIERDLALQFLRDICQGWSESALYATRGGAAELNDSTSERDISPN